MNNEEIIKGLRDLEAQLPPDATVGDYNALILRIRRDKYATPESIQAYLEDKGLKLSKQK